jgi:glucose/arabinose dehydrogenase
MKKAITILLILTLAGCAKTSKNKTPAISPSPVTNVIKANFPTAMQFRKDGTLLFTEKGGRVMAIKNGKLIKKPLFVIAVPKLTGYNETGLLGIAFQDSDPQNIYLYHTFLKNTRLYNRVIRVNLKTKNMVVLLDNINAYTTHNSGKMVFDSKGILYIETGDAQNKINAQNKNSLNGKILRIKPSLPVFIQSLKQNKNQYLKSTSKNPSFNPDPSNPQYTIPADNPFNNAVWSLGHRNMFGLTFDDENHLFSTENGTTKNDEINLIVKGGNYGWPIVTGNKNNKFKKPLVTFQKEIVPTGIAFFKQMNGKLLVGSFLNGQIISLDRDGSNLKIIASNQGKITDLAISPTKKVFVATETDIHQATINTEH